MVGLGSFAVRPGSCPFFRQIKRKELQLLRKTFKRLKIGIAVNPENFNIAYLRNIKNIVNIIYYDLNVYKTKSIKTYALMKCLKQIQSIKNLSIPVFIGGGINEEKANKIISLLKPDGIDVSRNLKNSKNIISSKKLKNFLQQVAVASITSAIIFLISSRLISLNNSSLI